MKTQKEITTLFSSPAIEKRLEEIRSRKEKNTFLASIVGNPTATILHEVNGHKTTLFPGNKGPKTATWKQTIQMAIELNKQGFDVAFLPELTFDTCADSLIKTGNSYRIADFKYCVTTKANTLAKDLEHGFQQASTIVLKLENMDAGNFSKAIDYLLRNEIPYGDFVLINRYGKTKTITYKDIRNNGYSKIVKGFL